MRDSFGFGWREGLGPEGDSENARDGMNPRLVNLQVENPRQEGGLHRREGLGLAYKWVGESDAKTD